MLFARLNDAPGRRLLAVGILATGAVAALGAAGFAANAHPWGVATSVTIHGRTGRWPDTAPATGTDGRHHRTPGDAPAPATTPPSTAAPAATPAGNPPGDDPDGGNPAVADTGPATDRPPVPTDAPPPADPPGDAQPSPTDSAGVTAAG